MGSNPAPSTKFFSLFFFFFLSFSLAMVLGQIYPPAPPCTYTPPFFMILIIPNIVQNLYLNLSMPFILGLHPPYPTSPTYPKPCYPTSPYPTPDRTLPPTPPYPPPPSIFFLNFHKNFSSPFTSTLTTQPDDAPPPP